MTANHSDARQHACIACLETLQPGARICPHCGSSQRPRRWHSVSEALKWIGGIVTVISLLGGLITLSGYYQDWRERRDTVAEIVAAADWLIRSENYRQAWEMYAKAAELNPSSKPVRDGRFRLSLLWLRNFGKEFERLDPTLTALGETLYRGLPGADADLSAGILAHIGYIQVLRQINRLPVRADAESLFAQALAANSDNVYANAMYARWLLLQRNSSVERLEQAHRHYRRALDGGRERAFVRYLQLLGYRNYASERNSELARAGLVKLVEASIEMKRSAEGYPPESILNDILRFYERLNLDEQLEPFIASLPAQTNLEVYQWLLQARGNSLDDPARRSTYVIARLLEEAGNRDAALDLYRKLHDFGTREKIAALVDRGIERLTGRLPERATARGYIDDPVDASNPFQFHLDTLENFDPVQRGDNLEQALDFFAALVAADPDQLTALELSLPTYIGRVVETVKHGDYVESIEAYTSGFNSYHHDNARLNWIELVLLYARLLAAGDQHDRALAQIGDLARAIGLLDREWRPEQARLDYEMARLYAKLAQRSGKAGEREQALTLLQSAVEKGVTDSGRVGWREIKAEPFTLLGNDNRYRELVRGR